MPSKNLFEVRENGLYSKSGTRWIGREGMNSIREQVLAERDKELGRWRSGEHPNYTIHRSGNGHYNLVDEQTGFSYRFTEGQVLRDDVRYRVVSEYFTAHPEKKPWHDAKPGEVWVLSYDCEEVVATLEKNGSWKRFDGEFESSGDLQYVRSAHRIWPESKES